MEENKNLFEKILNLFSYLTIFLLPIFFLPDLSIELGKQTVVVFMAGILFVAFLLYSSAKGNLIVGISRFTSPLLLLALAYFASFIVNGQRADAAPEVTSIISLFLIFLVMGSLPKPQKQFLFITIAFSISCMIIAIFSMIKLPFFSKIPQVASLPTYILIGSPLVDTIYILTSLILTTSLIIKFKENRKTYVPLVSMATVLTVGLFASLYNLKNNPPVILPFQFGYSIAISETTVNFPNNLLFGEGPGSFEKVFTRFKPAAINASPFWTSRFATSSNEIVNTIPTVGLIGLLALLSFFLAVYKSLLEFMKAKKDSLGWASLTNLTLLVLVSFLVSFSQPLQILLFLMAILVSLWQKSQEKTTDYHISILSLKRTEIEKGEKESTSKEKNNLLPKILIIPTVIILFLVDLFLARAALADIYITQSLRRLSENKATDVYNLQMKAIKLNPSSDIYHIIFSQTNLALATSLAQKKDLTDQDRQNVSTFVQQAINEAKTATNLSPQKAATWENLAAVYKALINFAQGADQWSIVSYLEAIKNDPLNPSLRLNLAGVYMLRQDYQNAIDQLNIAISLKNDYANVYYNLAYALKGQGKDAEAAKQFEIARNLVCTATTKDSGDCQKAQKDLDDILKKLASAKETLATESGNLGSQSAQLKQNSPIEPLSKTATASDSLKKALSPNIPPPNLGSPASTPKISPTTTPKTTPSPKPSPTPSPSRTP